MFFLVLDLGLDNSCDEENENDGDDGGDDNDDDAGDAGDRDSINDDKHPTGSDWGKYPKRNRRTTPFHAKTDQRILSSLWSCCCSKQQRSNCDISF